MPHPDTTSLILAVIAVSAAGQLLLFVAGALWLGRQIRYTRSTIARLETQYVPALATHLQTLNADLRAIALRVERTGAAIERTAHGAQAVVNLVGHEVERTTHGVHMALNVVGHGYRRVASVATGIRAGLRQLLPRRTQHAWEDIPDLTESVRTPSATPSTR